MKWNAIAIWLGVCLIVLPLAAQEASPLHTLHAEMARLGNPLDLPDAPSAIEAQPVLSNEMPRSTQEMLADDPYQPLTKQQKWHHFLHQTHAPTTFINAGEDILYTHVTGGFLYCCGASAWGKQYGATLADTEGREFFGNFLFPTLLKQDPRFFPKRRGSIAGRAWYAATRVLVTRNDSGNKTFNFSEVLGVAFAKALSNAYYPDRQRNMMGTANNILGTFQSDATTNLLSEFWPDIRRIVQHCTPRRLRSLEDRLPAENGPSQHY